MFEQQADAIRTLKAAGIQIGKIQVSSAIVLPLDEIAGEQRANAIQQLRSFAEDRYLHQTVTRSSRSDSPVFFEDLPRALEAARKPTELAGEWRVHYHVPIYLERFGDVQTSRTQIVECLELATREIPELSHFEVETYAWSVLPEELQQTDLSEGIAEELQWLSDLISKTGPIRT